MLVCVLQMAEATEAAGDYLHKELVDNAKKMSSFLQSILHANGSIPLLGDSAIDETPVPQVLETWTLDTMSQLAARNRCGTGSFSPSSEAVVTLLGRSSTQR